MAAHELDQEGLATLADLIRNRNDRLAARLSALSAHESVIVDGAAEAIRHLSGVKS